MFRFEISPKLNNHKTLQKENELKYLNAQLIESVSNKKTLLVKKLLEKIGDRHIQSKQVQTLLNIAINGDDIETTKIFIEYDPTLASLPNDNDLTPLLIAIGKGNKKIVELLLKYNVDVDKEFNGISPLSLAVSKGFTEVVDALIKYKKALPEVKATEGVKPKVASIYHDKLGRTLLTIASENNDIATAKCIIEHYPELVSELNADGSSALFVAVCKGNEKIVDLLISKGANVNQAINEETPIYMAAVKGYHTVVKLLLENKADSHIQNKQGQTLLSIAISGDDAKTAEVLFDHDPNFISLPNKKDLTPLFVAISKGKKNIVKLLLKYNVDVDQEFDGTSPLSLAVSKGFTEIVDALIKYKKALPESKTAMEQIASIDHDGFGRTLLTIASEKNDIETAKCIIEHYPELVTELNADGSSALFVAASKVNEKIVDLLISKGANVNQTINEATPIYMAAAKGYHTIVKLLLDNKADANQSYQNIQSTLSAAISSGSIETVAVLLKAKANVDTVDRDGMTPLHTAIHYQNHEMVKLILKYNPKDDLSKKDYLHMATENESLTRSLLKTKVDKNSIANKSVKNQFYDIIGGATPLTAAIVKNHDFLVHLEYAKSLQAIRLFPSQAAPLESKGSYIKVIAALLENKPQLDKSDGQGYLPLHYAAKNGDMELAKKLVESKANINTPTPEGEVPLMIAVRRNNPDLLNYLLGKKADVKCTDKNGNDLLMIAAYSGSYAVVSPLLKNFDVNKIDYSTGMTPLMAALYQYSESSEQFLKLEYLRTIEELLKNKASFMKKGGKSDSTPISFVIQNNLNNLLPILLKYQTGNDLNGYSNKTFCPLHEAVISNKEEACKILLNQPSVKVNQCDGNGVPALYYAIIKRQNNIVELLLKNGADTTLKCINNKKLSIDDLLNLDKHEEMRLFIQSIKEPKAKSAPRR